MIARFILVLIVFILVGMLTIWQKGQGTRAGYEVSRLEATKESLLRRNKSLRVESDRLKSPDALLSGLEKLELKLHIAGPDELIEAKMSCSQHNYQTLSAQERGESCRLQE